MRRSYGLLALLALWPVRASAWEYVNGSHPIWCDAARVRMLAPGSDDLGPELSESEVLRALDAWTAPECSTFRYEYLGTTTELGNPYDYDSLIYWDETTDWMTDAVGSTIVNSSPVTDGGNACIRSADIQLRGLDRTWTTDGSAAGGNVLYTFNVLAHEVGHLLGLGHSADTGAIMYKYASATPQTLNDDDIAGLCTLYGASGSVQDCSVEGCPNDMFCREGLCLSAGARCGGPIACEQNQVCTQLNVFSYCLDPCDFRVSAACAHPDRFCSPRAGDGSVGYCMPGKQGTADDGAPCTQDYDCASGMCEQGFCRTACSNQDDCAQGTYCTAKSGVGACLPALGFGASCEESAACLSGVCFDDDAYGSAYCSTSCQGSGDCPDGVSCSNAHLCSLAPPSVPGDDAGAHTSDAGATAAVDAGEPDSKDAGQVPAEDAGTATTGEVDSGAEVVTQPPPSDADDGDSNGALGTKSKSGGCDALRARGDCSWIAGFLLGVALLVRRRSAIRA